MYVDRLLLLAERLDTFEPERFDIRTYYSKNPYGTICCALGLATTMPEFQELGLKRNPVDEMPVYMGRFGTGAAQALFGLEPGECGRLFMPYAYAPPPNETTPQVVAARIRQFVAHHAKLVAMETES